MRLRDAFLLGFSKRIAEIPWRKIIAMRHKVVHDYLEINFDIVWGTADQ